MFIMSLLRILRPTPKTEQWPAITSAISKDLHEVKMHWFDLCVWALQKGIMADRTEKAKVVETTLGGSAALAITGYQLHCASRMIAKNSYLSKGAIAEFLDLLYSRISGIEASELLKSIRRYEQVGDDTATQHFRLAVDVTRYVINQEPSMIIALHASSLAQTLFIQTSMVIANTFGDLSRVDKLSRQLKSLSLAANP
jgi:hypothetical protein